MIVNFSFLIDSEIPVHALHWPAETTYILWSTAIFLLKLTNYNVTLYRNCISLGLFTLVLINNDINKKFLK